MMETMSFNDFLNTLTETQRNAVLACRTEEELEQIIDDYDIEIPNEMLASTSGGANFIPFAMAALMLFAGGCGVASGKSAETNSIAVQSVAEKNSVEAAVDSKAAKYTTTVSEASAVPETTTATPVTSTASSATTVKPTVTTMTTATVSTTTATPAATTAVPTTATKNATTTTTATATTRAPSTGTVSTRK